MAPVRVPESNQEKRIDHLAVSDSADVGAFEVLQKMGGRPRRARFHGAHPVIHGRASTPFGYLTCFAAQPRTMRRFRRPLLLARLEFRGRRIKSGIRIWRREGGDGDYQRLPGGK